MLIDLSGLAPVAHGRNRAVFQHPSDAGKLIKTILPRKMDKEPLRGWVERLRKPPYTWQFMKEIRMTYELARRMNSDVTRLPVCDCIGLVRTTLGLGLCVEKICNAEGELAPTLRQMLNSGTFKELHLERLNQFVGAAFEFGLIANDLKPDNLVFEDRSQQFVMVDGVGERTAIPLRLWSRRINARELSRNFAHYSAFYPGLTWDAERRAFSFATPISPPNS
ncbi:PhoP regulatory network protein YrbL [Poseidonocella pacifica]|uniref:PhoP regulatory network protein YrbL n=1 Tax=Poseidonocella pacifica TaxID=871651 RepID=A0A1I0V3G0_9RHOB|nr:YrbL family protein [Poseidonocella pacifica]SFA70811.1 PhoP regulatory network protein YrbL [Poseidonocella pacifica]